MSQEHVASVHIILIFEVISLYLDRPEIRVFFYVCFFFFYFKNQLCRFNQKGAWISLSFDKNVHSFIHPFSVPALTTLGSQGFTNRANYLWFLYRTDKLCIVTLQ